MGKAHLNREEYDDAIRELELAAKTSPKLPFVHFELGLAYMKKQDFDRARTEFLADVAIEPDLAYDYDQLGLIDYLQQKDDAAVKTCAWHCVSIPGWPAPTSIWRALTSVEATTRKR